MKRCKVWVVNFVDGSVKASFDVKAELKEVALTIVENELGRKVQANEMFVTNCID